MLKNPTRVQKAIVFSTVLRNLQNCTSTEQDSNSKCYELPTIQNIGHVYFIISIACIGISYKVH